MRPSHVLHTFVVADLRLLLQVQVSSGKQLTSVHAEAAPGRLLDELGDKRPALVRGDPGHGHEDIPAGLESRGQPCLLRLRQTPNVQRLVAQQFARQDWSRPDSQGCQRVDAQLRLHGWSKKRRVIIVRHCVRGGIAHERRLDDGKQLRLNLAGPSVHEGDRLRCARPTRPSLPFLPTTPRSAGSTNSSPSFSSIVISHSSPTAGPGISGAGKPAGCSGFAPCNMPVICI